jgi:hypothetical protein
MVHQKSGAPMHQGVADDADVLVLLLLLAADVYPCRHS